MTLKDSQLPAKRAAHGDGPPQPRMWAEKRPEAAVRHAAAREAIADLCAAHHLPAENLLQPDALRRLCWEYESGGEDFVRSFLVSRSARQWQIDLVTGPLAEAFTRDSADVSAPLEEPSV